MKFRVRMKDPDALDDAIVNTLRKDIRAQFAGRLSPEEMDVLLENRTLGVKAMCSRWFDMGEYLEVEIDTDAKTCVVVEQRE